MKGIPPVILLLATALAGCSGGAPEEGEASCGLEPALCDPQHYLASHSCITGDVRPRVYAPDTGGPDSPADPWKQGDWWSYRMNVGGRQSTSTLVYYEDVDMDRASVPQHYLVGTPSREEALDHALFSTNPMLGRIHRALYSPHEKGDHADMFHFPLCAGSTWTTRFYGTDFRLRAEPAALDLPGGQRDPLGFRITGSAGDGSRLTHAYSPVAKWFTSLDLQRADGGRVTMELVDRGSGRQGAYHFLRAQQDEVLDLGAIGQEAIVGRQDGGEGPYDGVALWIDAQRSAGQGRVEVHVRNPAGDSVACVGFAGQGIAGATSCPAGPVKLLVPYRTGEWKVTVERPLAALDDGTRVSGEARIVSVYDRSGTV